MSIRNALPAVRYLPVAIMALAVSACAPAPTPSDAFFESALSLCGQPAISGRVVSDQAVDAGWIGQPLTVGPVTCEADTVLMPLAVGDDASRIWRLERRADGLEFRHLHFEPDGSPSPVTNYGGPSLPGGTATRQRFPADASTQANFTANGIARSNTNVWTLDIDLDGRTLRYALERPATDTEEARDFRAVFDLPPE